MLCFMGQAYLVKDTQQFELAGMWVVSHEFMNWEICPNLYWFLVSHQVLYQHTMRVGGYYHYVFIHSWQIFSPNDSTSMLQHLLYIVLEGLVWMLCSRQTHWFMLCSSLCLPIWFMLITIWFIHTLTVCENRNNGDKFYSRKFMWGADEKLIP